MLADNTPQKDENSRATSSNRRKSAWPRTLRFTLCLSAGLLLGLFVLCLPQLFSETTFVTSYISNLVFEGNFHVVVPGRLYRSGELEQVQLEKAIKTHGIKTIIDLRRSKDAPNENGLREADIAQANGAVYYHRHFVSSRANQQDRMLSLLSIFDQVEEPLLIHCRSGTHRTGVAAAAWLLDQGNASTTKAAAQLHTRYGFFYPERRLKGLVQGHPTLDQMIWKYVKVKESQPLSFRDWLMQVDEQTLR